MMNSSNFPGSKALFERGATVAWVNEPHSRGGYAALGRASWYGSAKF